MSFKKWCAFALAGAFVGTLTAAGCSSSSSNTSNPTDGGSEGGGIIHRDSGPSGDDSGGDDSSTTDGGMCPITGYMPMKWAPPSPWGQGVCTSAQVTSFVTACLQSSSTQATCSAYLNEMANQACKGCMISQVGQGSSYGPLLLFPDPKNPMNAIIVLNLGGCEAHYDMMTAAGSCGNKEEDGLACGTVDCSQCAGDTAFQNCIQNPPAECNQFASSTCDAEFNDGGAAANCLMGSDFTSVFTNLANLWCGGGDGGGVSDAGGGG
jgi:hypothetical protein